MDFTDNTPPMNWSSAKLSHAYIASGRMADAIAMAAVCSGVDPRPCMSCVHCAKSSRGIHPDITIVSKPGGKREILVDQIRALKRDIIVVPNESSKRAYIIDEADSMNISAQNAFLRILEEPPAHAVFILRTTAPTDLLPTVRSRCVELKGKPETLPTDPAILEVTDEFFSALRQGGVSLINFMFRLEKLDKEQFTDFLAAAHSQASMELRAAAGGLGIAKGETGGGMEDCMLLSRAEQVLAKAEEYLDFNVGSGHISGLICATLMRIRN